MTYYKLLNIQNTVSISHLNSLAIKVYKKK